jgi:hypothetical protein
MLRRLSVSLLALVCLSGCSPRFNWREVHANDAYLATFPARAQHQTQQVEVGAQQGPMTMTGAEVDHISFVIGLFELKPDVPGREAAPATLALALAKNLDIDHPALMPAQLRLAQSKERAGALAFHFSTPSTEVYGEVVEHSGHLIEILVAGPVAAFKDPEVLLAKDTFFDSVELY